MSTLNQELIVEKVNSINLINKQNYDETRIKQACYEARVSNDFFEIVNDHEVKRTIKDGEAYILRPNNQVVCVTKEYFNIPNNMIARIVLKGDYFSLGIAPVNTYADPGFKGRLGIVLSNTSRNYIKLKPGDPLTKIEFSTLTADCTEGYVGQHGGDVTTWPVRGDLIASDDELKKININKNSNDEIKKIYGDTLAKTIADIHKTKRDFVISAIISTVLPLMAIWGVYEKWSIASPILSTVIGLVTGLASNYIYNKFSKK